MVIRGFYFIRKCSTVALLLIAVGCTAIRDKHRTTFTFQKDLNLVPQSITMPKTEKTKVYEKILTLTADILQGSLEREFVPIGERFVISCSQNKKIKIDITEGDDWITISTNAESAKAEKAINYYFLTGVFERQYLE